VKPLRLLLALLPLLAARAVAAEGDDPRFKVKNTGDEVEISVSHEYAPGRLNAADPSERGPAPVIPADAKITELVRRCKESFHPDEKLQALSRLAELKPERVDELRALMDLYDRDLTSRTQIERSLARLSPADRRLAPFFTEILGMEEEPSLILFALIGIDRLQPPEALPFVEKTAGTPFEAPRPDMAAGPAGAQKWAIRFRCLQILARWKGTAALPLILKRAQETPLAAALVGRGFWEPAFDRIVRWSDSKDPADRALSDAAWNADTPREALLRTKPALWKLVLDPRRGPETRHQAAIKLGICADEGDVDRLLKARTDAKKEADRLVYTTAIFASRSPKAVPILVEFAKTHPDPLSRAGVLEQLREMMKPEEFRALLRWVVANDKDEENRRHARQLMRSTPSTP